MRATRFFSDTIGLRRAGAIIFMLVALLPLLALLPVLRRTGALRSPEAQVSLLLSLTLAFLGFAVLRRMLGQVTSLAAAVAVPGAEAESAARLGDSAVPGLGRVVEIGQIGGAFARMLEELRGSTDRLQDLVFKLSALNELVELAARVPKMQDLLNLVLERTMRTVRARTGSIMLLDPERRVLQVVAARGGGEEAGAPRALPVGEGMAGRVARLGEPELAGDAVCLPIRVEDRIIGVVNLSAGVAEGGGARAFGPSDLQFLNTLLAQVAYALENARLLEEAQRSAARLRQAFEDLKAAQARVVEGETLRAMGQMASGMAHHLNNLLSVISGRNQLLLLRVQDPGVRGPLEVVQRATLDAAEVVRRVLGFTGTRRLGQAVRVDLNDLVREVIELTRPRWQDQAQVHGVTIALVSRLGEVPPVAGEAPPLREVIMNILLNAADALPAGGTITVTTHAGDGHVVCEVADTGVGMTDDVRRRALEPFFTTKGPQNTGLGLSVAHGIVQRHGGELSIGSAPGRGTVVTVRLPEAGPDAVAQDAPRPPEAAAALRILLIDDEPRVRAALAEALAELGHAVVQTAGGREGLERLESGEGVDLVITDLGMPDMNGWDVVRLVRARWPDLPVGLVTGWAAGRELGPEDLARVAFVISKPYTLETLAAALAPVRPR